VRLLLATLALACAACEPAIPILLWHHVGAPIDPPRFVAQDVFEQQIDRLLAEGYTPITASELDAIEAGNRASPPRPVALTFDDGYVDFQEHAWPVLEARGMSATLFVIAARTATATRFIDAQGPYLLWPELRAMRSEGLEIQSHTVTHRNLKALEEEDVLRELRDSRAQIEAGTGARVTVVAYPFGGNSPHTQALTAEAGYTSAHSVIAGLDERFARLRISVHASTTPDDIARALEGSWWASSSR